MKNIILDENEKKSILSMHKVLMRNANMVNIQEQPTTGPVVNTDEQILRKAYDFGCLKNGKFISNRDNTKTIYRATTKSGKIIEFSADMTYKFQDGSKSGKWKGSRIETASFKIEKLKNEGWKTYEEIVKDGVNLNTLDKTHKSIPIEGTNIKLYREIGKENVFYSGGSTSDFNKEQQEFIDGYLKRNYVLNPSRYEQQYMKPITDKQLNAPPDLFPNGLTLWYDPRNQSQMGSDYRPLQDILDSQGTDRKTCKNNINDYYEQYRRRNSSVAPPMEFEEAKLIVQACKDKWYGRWPALTGGKKMDEILDFFTGAKAGGPEGEFQYFRLK